MFKMRVRAWLLGLLSLILMPSAFAAFDFTQPFGMVFSVINDLFTAANNYIPQEGFQRFMYWLLIFCAVFFGGSSLKRNNEPMFNKRMVTMLAAILATAGAFATPTTVMQSLGSLVGIIIPFGLLFGLLFFWVYSPTFMANRPRVRHFVRFLVYIFGMAATSYLFSKFQGAFTSTELGNLLFQLMGLFFAVMTIYELIMIFAAGAGAAGQAIGGAAQIAGGAAQGAANLGAGAVRGAANLNQAGQRIRDFFPTLFGARRPNGQAPYANFDADMHALEMQVQNIMGASTRLRNYTAQIPAMRGNAAFIARVRREGRDIIPLVNQANAILNILTTHDRDIVARADRQRLNIAAAQFAQFSHEFLASYGWLQTHMY